LARRAHRGLEMLAKFAVRPRLAFGRAPVADGSVRVHQAAESVRREVPRPVAESYLDIRRIVRLRFLDSSAARARTMHTSAIHPERLARIPLEIVGTVEPPSLVALRCLHSLPRLPRNMQRATNVRVPDGACAPRAQPGAQAPVPSARCSVQPAPTTQPRAPNSPIPPIDIGCSSRLSIMRYFGARIGAEEPFSRDKCLRSRSRPGNACLAKPRASKTPSPADSLRRRDRRSKTCLQKSTAMSTPSENVTP